MPRYHFHMKDGTCLEDEGGTELPSLAAAKDTAVRVMTESLQGRPGLFWEEEAFSIVVTDDDRLSLFTVDMSVSYAPALSPGGHGARRSGR